MTLPLDPAADGDDGRGVASPPGSGSVIVERVLSRTPCASLEDYCAGDGMRGLIAARAVSAEVVVAVLEDSGLRGRGGAGFPTGLKWRTVLEFASQEGPAPVVVNAAEGEPGTFKDRALIRGNPYRVLEGALIACRVTGASELVIAIKESFEIEIARLRHAAHEVSAGGWADGIDIRVEAGPSHYLFGEETALLNVLEGGQPFPRVTPPYRRGFDLDSDPDPDRSPALATNDPRTGTPPALVNNVETFANVPGIVAQGAAWFRECGTAESPGTVVCTITGSTNRHGVAEVAMGTRLTDAINEIGGGPRLGRTHVGAISGVANAFITADAFDTPLTYEHMSAIGSGLGSAGFIVFDDDDDLYGVAAQISRFLAVESCGQCEPCKRDGLAIADTFIRDAGDNGNVDGAVNGARVRAERRDRLATVADGARCALARQHRDVISSMLDIIEIQSTPSADRAEPASTGSDPDAGQAVVLPIREMNAGRAEFDERQVHKQPDWSYNATDSGTWPAEGSPPLV